MKNTHKRFVRAFLVPSLLLCLLLSLAGCGGDAGGGSAPDSGNAGGTSGTARVYQVASGSSTGAYYLQITPIAALWEQLDFVRACSVQATSGTLENTVLISQGSADAGLIDTFAYFAAVEGTEPYTEPYGGYSAIAAGAPSLATVVVRKDSDIQSISDLAGHSIAVGLAGSGAEFEERFMLEALGMSYSDFSHVDQIGIGPGFTAFQDGKVDAVIALMGAGNSSLMEAMTNVDVRILPFGEDEVSTILAACPYFVQDTLPGGSYEGIGDDINTVSIPCILVISDQLSEEEGYQMTRKVYENIEELKSANTNFEQWSFGTGCSGNVPLHPGAEKFYADNGISAG